MDPFLPDPVGYKSHSQRARVATESWVAGNLYCPACSSPRLDPTLIGHPVADFVCPKCGEEYQLKSKHGKLGARITDAAYSEALRAAERNAFPHLLLMQYAAIPGPVVTLQAVPGRICDTECIGIAESAELDSPACWLDRMQYRHWWFTSGCKSRRRN